MQFIYSFQSEWLKKKRSLASWLVLVGGIFTPLLILSARIYSYKKIENTDKSKVFWFGLWNQSWESMALLMLPIGITLAVGLICQIEYKNNTWKQLHTTPQHYSIIFFAKLLVILVLLLEVFLVFNFGMYLSGVVPALIHSDAVYPLASIPFEVFAKKNLDFFVTCLPIVALQYLVSLQFKNFLVPIGFGFIFWMLGIGLFSWEYSYFMPYVVCGTDFLISSGNLKREVAINLQLLSLIYFAVITLVSYLLYVTKREKG